MPTAVCPKCEANNRVTEESAGTQVRCHQCKTVFVPAKPATAPEAAPEAAPVNRGVLLLGIGLIGFSLLGLCGVGAIAGYLFWPRPQPIALDARTPIIDEKKQTIVEEKKPVIEETKPIIEEKRPVIEKPKPIEEKKKRSALLFTKTGQVFDAGKRYPRDIEDFSVSFGDVSLRKIVPSAYTHTPLWHADGKSFYAVQVHNYLMQIDASDFSLRRDRVFFEDKNPVFFRGGLTMSAEGLLGLCSINHDRKGEDIQLTIIDPITLMPTKKIPCPNAGLVLSAPSLSLAWVGGKNTYADGAQCDVSLVDLKTGTVTKLDVNPPLRPETFALSPDGKFFFGTDGKAIARFRIDGTRLVHEQTSTIVAKNANLEPCLGMSPDGERVWLLGIDSAARKVPNGYQFRIMNAADLRKGFYNLGFPVSALGFDPRDKAYVGFDGTLWFLIKGPPERYPFKVATPSQIVVSPLGGAALMQCGRDLYHVHWPPN